MYKMVRYNYAYDMKYFKIYSDLAKKIMMRDKNVFMDESNITTDMVSHAAAAAGGAPAEEQVQGAVRGRLADRARRRVEPLGAVM